jgi:hypothetical protein
MFEGHWGDHFSVDVGGKIDYRDNIGTVRRTAFARRYTSLMLKFKRIEDDDLDYED